MNRYKKYRNVQNSSDPLGEKNRVTFPNRMKKLLEVVNK